VLEIILTPVLTCILTAWTMQSTTGPMSSVYGSDFFTLPRPKRWSASTRPSDTLQPPTTADAKNCVASWAGFMTHAGTDPPMKCHGVREW